MGLLKGLLSVGGGIVGGAIGGPAGAKIGASLGGAVGGAVSSSGAAKKATKAQIEAENRAEARRQQAAGEVRTLQAPGVQAYNTGVNALTGRLGLTPAPMVPSTLGATPAATTNALSGAPLPSAGVYGAVGAATGGAQQPQTLPAAAAAAQPAGPAGIQPTGAIPTNPTTAAQATGMPGTYGNAVNPVAPTYTAPEEYSYGVEDYDASPALQFQLNQAREGTLAANSVTGSLRSGAAAKELQDRAQQIAYQDFGKERAFDFGRYTDQRDFDRGVYQDDRKVYENDRNYLSNRYDQGTSDLFKYTGLGENALRTTTNAVMGYGSEGAQGEINKGQITAGNALAQGDIWGGLVSNLGGLAAGALGGAAKTATNPNTVPYDPSMVNIKTPANPFAF